MGREIKFRAWDKRKKKWINDVLIVADSGGTCRYGMFETLDDVEVELSQYTGLKDKNGKEIYEGDQVHVVEVSDLRGTEEWDAPVVWEGNGWYLYDQNDIGCPLDGFGDGVNSLSELEIIGNIYENPELLEG